MEDRRIQATSNSGGSSTDNVISQLGNGEEMIMMILDAFPQLKKRK
jgi:hypothetical protein